MVKYLKIFFIKWKIWNLNSELNDFRALLEIRNHYYGGSLEVDEMYQKEKSKIKKKISDLESKISQLKNN